jgi:hypothetical protein
MDLAKVGYEEQEYFFRGVATRYDPVKPSPPARSARCRTRRGSSVSPTGLLEAGTDCSAFRDVRGMGRCLYANAVGVEKTGRPG